MFGLREEIWKEKGGINTAREIYQQPELWLETLKIVESNKATIENFMKDRMRKEKIRVIFSGAGTSAYIGDIVVPYLNENKEYIYEAIPTTDIVTNPQMYFKKDIPTILVSFARSGNSPESIATYNLANQLVDDISHIFITCNQEGELAKISKNNENVLLLLMPEKSNDKGFAMTSSFTCMTLTALLIFDMENFEDNKKQVIEMVNIGKDILNNGYRELEKLLDYDFERVVYLGSGSLHGLSKESALKLLELTSGKIISHSETVLGFRHGPKSIVNDDTLIFVYISADEYVRKYDLDIVREIYEDAGNHKVIAISQIYDEELKKYSDSNWFLSTNKKEAWYDVYSVIVYILYAQIFALLTSIKLGIEPDNPSPRGIVNRVVKGVKIYEFK